MNPVVEVEMQQPRLSIIEADESRLCSGPETVAAAVVNTVVEVEDPTAQITDLNICSLKESPNITAQSIFLIKGKHHEIYFSRSSSSTIYFSLCGIANYIIR